MSGLASGHRDALPTQLVEVVVEQLALGVLTVLGVEGRRDLVAHVDSPGWQSERTLHRPPGPRPQDCWPPKRVQAHLIWCAPRDSNPEPAD
jgi:hypothetical protein